MSYEERFEAKCQGAILQMFERPSFFCLSWRGVTRLVVVWSNLDSIKGLIS